MTGKLPDNPLPVMRPCAAQAAIRARHLLQACRLCARRCGVNRLVGQLGVCGRSAEPSTFYRGVVTGGEADLMPSYEVRFGGCNMRCDFCESGESSQNGLHGRPFHPHAIAAEIASQAPGIRSVSVLGGEPTVHLDAALAVAAATPPNIPFVWNTNALASPETLDLLDGVVDVFLPDFKFGSDACARRIAAIPDYLAPLRRNLLWAARHTRLIVRHLLLPGHFACCFLPILEYMAAHLPGVPLSLMEGYVPEFRARAHAQLARTVTPAEAAQAREAARARGVPLAPWSLAPYPSVAPRSEADERHTIWVTPDGRIHVQTESSQLACLIRSILPEFNPTTPSDDR